MKKAQGISINVIIIAAIALVVMVLIILIFTGNVISFRKSSQGCLNVGGECVSVEECNTRISTEHDGYLWQKSSHPCFDSDNNPTNQVCCMKA
jgi:uncharacterized membrane protein YqiK